VTTVFQSRDWEDTQSLDFVIENAVRIARFGIPGLRSLTTKHSKFILCRDLSTESDTSILVGC